MSLPTRCANASTGGWDVLGGEREDKGGEREHYSMQKKKDGNRFLGPTGV